MSSHFRHFALFGVLFLVLQSGCWTRTANAQSNSSDPSYSEWLVAHVGFFDFRLSTHFPDQIWVLAEITPDADSGRVVNVTTDPKTGLTMAVPGTIAGNLLKGTFRIVTPLAGVSHKKVWKYRWVKPCLLGSQMVGTITNDDYLPFSSHNFVICRLNEHRPDGNPLDMQQWDSQNLYIVPSEWTRYVVPAYRYIQENDSLFEENQVLQRKEELQKLLHSDNPFLVIASLRTLTRTKALDEVEVQALMKSSSGLKQAVFTYILCTDIGTGMDLKEDIAALPDPTVKALLIKSGMAEKDIPSPSEARLVLEEIMAQNQTVSFVEMLSNTLTSIIRSEHDSAKIEGLALGLVVAKDVDTGHFSARLQRKIPDLLLLLRQNLTSQGMNTDIAKQLNLWLVMGGALEKS